MMNNNLQMREVPNGCITIDARHCSQKLGLRACFGLQSYATILVGKSKKLNFVLVSNEVVENGD